MKIVIAIDSFKGSLTSLEAGEAIRTGIEKIQADANVVVRPLADGGEGTVEALTLGMGGKLEHVLVRNPIGREVDSCYGVCENQKLAIIEMSAAAGIMLLKEKERDPYVTTSYGVGQMILNAIEKGCRYFIVGIGGSATNDGGVGMLQALGYQFLDENGEQVCTGAIGLKDIMAIDDKNVIPELAECDFRIACDVKNPLCGEHGCSAVFGPQKGANAEQVKKMDQWLAHYGKLTKQLYPNADVEFPGTGAAGGLGFAFLAYLNATLESGIQIVLEETKLETYIKDADLVITGEGRLDAQTTMGKAPMGVAALAKRYGKKVIAFSGCVGEDATICNECGIDAFFPILQEVVPLEKAMDRNVAKGNMIRTVEQVFRLISCLE